MAWSTIRLNPDPHLRSDWGRTEIAFNRLAFAMSTPFITDENSIIDEDADDATFEIQ